MNKRETKQWHAIGRIRGAADTKPPTLQHRPALTFGILGTVYGINAEGEVRYFDYDWAAALKFAGVMTTRLELRKGVDLRISTARRPYTLPGYDMWYPERRVRKGERAWWVLKRTDG